LRRERASIIIYEIKIKSIFENIKKNKLREPLKYLCKNISKSKSKQNTITY